MGHAAGNAAIALHVQGKHLSGAIVKNGGSTANADQNDVVANAKHVVRR
jgi:hypothetical protein